MNIDALLSSKNPLTQGELEALKKEMSRLIEVLEISDPYQDDDVINNTLSRQDAIIRRIERSLKALQRERLEVVSSYTYNNIKYSHYPDKPTHTLEVYATNQDGEEVGYAVFAIEPDLFSGGGVKVEPAYQRLGIATEMYKYAEKIVGRKLSPSKARSPAAKKFWEQKNRSFGALVVVLSRTLKSEELQEFEGLADSYDEWYRDQREYFEEYTPTWTDGWDEMEEHEKENQITDDIKNEEESADSTMVFFREPKRLPANSWVVHFTDKNPTKFFKNLKGCAPTNIGLTHHEGCGDGDLVFSLHLPRIDASKEYYDYGSNAILLQVGEAVEARHISDGDEYQTVFDKTTIKKSYPILRDAKKNYIVKDPKAPDQTLFVVKPSKDAFKKIVEKLKGPLKKRVQSAYIIVEKDATSGAKGDWEKEGYKVKHIESINDYHRFGAFLKNRMIGELSVSERPSDLFVEGVGIEKEHRRKGLGTALYELAEKKLKKPIFEASYKSQDAKKLWKSFGGVAPDFSESAPASDALKKEVYYHGTKTQKQADKIWKEGIQPNLWVGDNTLGRPIENRVYITKNLEYALHYALGAAVAGTDSDYTQKLIEEYGQYGFIAVIPGSELKEVHADEDQIGEAVHDAFKYKTSSWLRNLGEEHLHVEAVDPEFHDSLLSQLKEGDYDAYIAAGKILMDVLTPEQHLDIIEEYGNISHEGVLKPSELWRIDRNKIPELKKDGSNFFKVAEKVKG